MTGGGHVRPIGDDGEHRASPAGEVLDPGKQPPLFELQGRFERYEAPTIPVEVIQQLNAIQPELGTEIARLTLEEAEHRRGMERDDLAAHHSSDMRAQWMAFVFVMAALGSSVFAIAQGQEVAGGAVGLGAVGMVLVSVLRRR